MKASLLAISISSVLAAPVFASAPQVNVELANQQTLQLIDGQMSAIDVSVQYKLNEQYANATPGTTATVDDVTYEKQSNGTWAAVGAASAALVAGLLSSSSSSSSSDNGNTIPELPVTTSMDSVGTWKVADNDSGYIVTIAGQEVYVDSSNVTLNNDGTATIVVNDRKLIVGINGDELYRVDQVSRPDLDIPADMPQLSDPEYGNGIADQGWTRVDIGAGVEGYYKFENVTEDGVGQATVQVKKNVHGDITSVTISGNTVDGTEFDKDFDGSKISNIKDFIDEHLKPADMPQLSDPEYGNGIADQGWTRVDIGAGVEGYYKFENVTEDGVGQATVQVKKNVHGDITSVTISGNTVDGTEFDKDFDGSKISNIKDFIDEHLKPADMPQLSDPEYGNGIADQGWTRVDIGAGVEGYYKFENVTEDGVGQATVQVKKNVHGDITSVTISGNTVDGTEFDKDFDGSKISNIKDFIDEHLKPADMPQLSDPEYGNGIADQGWTRVDIGAGVEGYYKFENVTEDGVGQATVQVKKNVHGDITSVTISGNTVDGTEFDKDFDGSKISNIKDFIDEHLKPADMPQLSDPEYGNGIADQGWTRVDIGAGVEGYYKFENVTEDGVGQATVQVKKNVHGDITSVTISGNTVDGTEFDKDFDGSKISNIKDFIDEHLKPADMPQLSDPEYGNGIADQGWTRVDIGAGVEGYYKFENVTEDGVGQATVQVKKNVHGDITSVTISGNTVDGTEFDKDFDGSKISNIKDFIDEHLKPADMPQLSDPEYGNGIADQGWTRVDIGAGVEGYYKFENVTEDGVGQATVQVKKNVHGDITSVTISGNTVDGTEFDKDFDGSKISNIKDFIDEHLKPADVTLPPAVKNNVKDKVQSIDPAKLQKAKSAIQQRLRG